MNKLELSSLYQLTMARFRLFLREPEAIFWIFIFPILLAVGLGIAFRNRPADVLQVGATTVQLTHAMAADKGLTSTTMNEAEGTHELATGQVLLLAIQRADGVAYKYDDTNPDARTARLLADRAIQAAAGRKDAVQAGNELVQPRIHSMRLHTLNRQQRRRIHNAVRIRIHATHGKLHNVLAAYCPDQLLRSPQRNHLSMVHNRHAIA